MQFANLDSIVRRTLLEKGLPIHWYAEVLFHQASAIRELAKDTLQIINSANLPVGTYGEVDLPADFVDDVEVAFPWGGILQPVPKHDNVNPIRVHSPDTGQFEPQPSGFVLEGVTNFYGTYGLWGALNWFWNVSDWGEGTGRLFGAPGGVQYGYSVIRQRRQIQMVGTGIAATNIILLYVSNGQSVDNATQIDWRAFSAIQAYSEWKRSPNANDDFSPEGRAFYNQKRLLRANMNELTPETIRNVFRNNFRASPKQ